MIKLVTFLETLFLVDATALWGRDPFGLRRDILFFLEDVRVRSVSPSDIMLTRRARGDCR